MISICGQTGWLASVHFETNSELDYVTQYAVIARCVFAFLSKIVQKCKFLTAPNFTKKITEVNVTSRFFNLSSRLQNCLDDF